jgi:hypothetical protein
MKQTAVDWLQKKLIESGISFLSEEIEYINQAKEMEKEQSIDFAKLCLNKAKDLDILTAFINAQQYYETYK